LVGKAIFDGPNVAAQLPSHTFSGASASPLLVNFGVLRGSAVIRIAGGLS
jgi:hypothetical protein